MINNLIIPDDNINVHVEIEKGQLLAFRKAHAFVGPVSYAIRKKISWWLGKASEELMMMMMMNCFCGMADWRKAFSLISSRCYCQRSSASRFSDTPRVGFEPAQKLSSGLAEWSCAIVITTTLRRVNYELIFIECEQNKV